MIGIKLEPSRIRTPHDPGHMVVFWENDEEPECRGYRFEISSLPKKIRSDKSKWRDFLFQNSVKGRIVDDINFYKRCVDSKNSGNFTFLMKDWELTSGTPEQLDDETMPRDSGRYSFNPHTNDANNCVTWATSIVQKFAGTVIEQVYEGRISDMVNQLSDKPFRRQQ